MWALVTGFDSPFPWFYPVFFVLMISHRAYRDLQRCEAKYGDAWQEYKRRVPWLFIPVSHPSISHQSECFVSLDIRLWLLAVWAVVADV